MFVILNGEAQFTVNGRTARIQGPAAVVCRMGDSHALLNTGTETLQWMNFQASSVAGVTDAFDLGDDRVGAAVDRVPTFISARLDRALIRPGRRPRPGRRGAAGAHGCHVAAAVRASRVPVGMGLCRSRAGRSRAPARRRTRTTSVGEAYYVLAGSGTVKVGTETAPVQRWNAIPVTIGETSSFTNTGSEPLELLVVAVARDMEAKTAVLRGGARP